MKLPPPRKLEDAPRHLVQLPAGDARLDEVQALRYRVYIEEQMKPLAAADHARRRLCDRLDPSATHFVSLSYDTVIAAGRINIVPLSHELIAKAGLGPLREVGIERAAYVSKLVVTPERRASSTLAARMMIAMLVWGMDRGLEVGFCHCHEGLVPMYERLGLSRLRRPWMDPELGPQTLLVVYADKSEALSRFNRSATAVDLSDDVRERCTAARVLIEQIDGKVFA